MTIADTVFENCEGTKGGALAIYNVPNFKIYQSTVFKGNKASD